MTEPARGRLGIPHPRRPEQQARWGQPGYRDLVVALLPVNDYSITEIESVLTAISRHVVADPGNGTETGHGECEAPATAPAAHASGAPQALAKVLVRTASGAVRCTPHQLHAVAGSGQVSSVAVHWTYRDGSQLRGQLIATGHRGRLLAEPGSMAHTAAAVALVQMRQVRPGRRRWLTWMSRWLLPTTCASSLAIFTYLAWRGLHTMRAQAEAAGVPWLMLLTTLATALFFYAVVLAAIAPGRRYSGTRMRPGPLGSVSETRTGTPAATAPASSTDAHLLPGPGATLARWVQRWPEAVALICAFAACISVAAVAVLLLA